MDTNFEFAFQRMMRNEGGFVLHKNEGDRGGWTFAGIAENFWPDWAGWSIVKSGREDDPHLTQLVRDFYKTNFWDRISLDDVQNKIVTYNIFDFAVNAGTRTSSKLAQIAVGATPDGIIGPKSIAALNKVDQQEFELKFAIAKIKRYIHITDKNRTQTRFLRGWIKRTLNVLAE